MLCLFKVSKPNASCSQVHSTSCSQLLHFYTLLYNLILSCSITSAHINSYLSNIVTRRQSKNHQALRTLRKSPIYNNNIDSFQRHVFTKYLRIMALSNQILAIHMRHIFKYAYNPKHRC